MAVDVAAETLLLSQASATAIRLNPKLWLQLRLKFIAHEDLYFVMEGLKLVEKQIEEYKTWDEPVLISVTAIEFTPTDFQPEALACAIVGWAAQEFHFQPPNIPITFDHRTNRYIVKLS